ncbi:MAG TPA: ankyrin repeat domain-containing protein [Pyrinomonadaceae bacterium]|jgi:ankyrin repeat protein
MKARGFNVFVFAFSVATLLVGGARLATRSEAAGRSFVSAARRGDVTVMRLWLLAGADVNTRAPEGGGARRWTSPLEAAVEGGQAEAVRLLLARGAEVDSGDLLFAAERGAPETRDLILTESHGRRVCRNSDDGEGALLAASESGREGVVRLLLSYGCGAGGGGVRETALRRAIINGHRGVVAALLEAGADVNHLSEHEIALGGITVLQVALNHQDPEIIALVRRAGAK